MKSNYAVFDLFIYLCFQRKFKEKNRRAIHPCTYEYKKTKLILNNCYINVYQLSSKNDH
jgi:hypothetical protein